MIVIDDKRISDDIIEEQFVCDLLACKGACCVEGDIGAPLEESELKTLDDIFDKVKTFLTKEGIEMMEKNGKYLYIKEEKHWATPLMKHNNGCAWMNYDKNGVVICGIEKAYNEGLIDFKKPISCHLYPIRLTKYKHYEAVNYERWNVCKAACKNGKALKVPMYKFLKESITRKYGEEFYKVLEKIAEEKK